MLQASVAAVFMEKFQELRVWKDSRILSVLVYRETRSFPPEERYGLASQMRRAAVSVAADIAEGSKKRSAKDRRHFHEIAETSLEELKSHVFIASDLGFLRPEPAQQILNDARSIGRMLARLNQTLRDAPA